MQMRCAAQLIPNEEDVGMKLAFLAEGIPYASGLLRHSYRTGTPVCGQQSPELSETANPAAHAVNKGVEVYTDLMQNCSYPH